MRLGDAQPSTVALTFRSLPAEAIADEVYVGMRCVRRPVIAEVVEEYIPLRFDFLDSTFLLKYASTTNEKMKYVGYCLHLRSHRSENLKNQ